MRYTIDGTVKISDVCHYDVVIIGAGLAGLYAALNIDSKYSCCVLAKETVDISNSWLAQGGIAVVLTPQDKPELHLADTLVAGAGLCDEDAVDVLVKDGTAAVKDLIDLNVPFDLDESGELDFTREGGHHMNRIVHAGGDATGREATKTLAYIVSQRLNITFHENTFFVDIITDDTGKVTGIIAKTSDGRYHIINTSAVIIATGGIGQVYKTSTNPEVATGDGIAAAMRAGAEIKNMEFIQFHPTGLWSDTGEKRAFLISESVRGEGGLLKNKDGVRFMEGTHELNELAPRDIVARAILREMQKNGDDHEYIDITSESEEFLKGRFPTIFNACLDHGINISKDWIPVCPVQHYFMGGIKTDLNAQTNISGLYACGEAACTGVHGANRLASNSMLECLVFGKRAAIDINKKLEENSTAVNTTIPVLPKKETKEINCSALRDEVQQLMNDYCCVVRTEEGMTFALNRINKIYAELEETFEDSDAYKELVNIVTIAIAILKAAIARKESIGAHYRED